MHMPGQPSAMEKKKINKEKHTLIIAEDCCTAVESCIYLFSRNTWVVLFLNKSSKRKIDSARLSAQKSNHNRICLFELRFELVKNQVLVFMGEEAVCASVRISLCQN
jgi:hypothetical protein